MAQTVRDVMTANPRTVDVADSILEAARAMRDEDTGALVVTENGRVVGVVTDRDVVVRAIADDREPGETSVGEILSRDVVTLQPSESVERAVELMRERAVRRLPVVEGDRPVGIVSLGDLAMERDEQSALAQISGAPSNN